jgi:uncharacterized protein with PIN domain
MLKLEETEELWPVCPHCEATLECLLYRRIRQAITSRRVYFCPECRKVVGVTHDGNPWLGI